MKKDNIIIFISCYNRIRYIERALKSAAIQEYENKKIVVMDDCSNDGSYERLLELQKICDFILLKTDRPRRGTYWMSNRVIENFDAQYYQILDSDDILFKGATLRMLDFMKRESADIVGGQYVIVDADDNDITGRAGKIKWKPFNANLAYKIKRGQYVNRSAMLFKKTVIDRIGLFNEGSVCTMDYEFCLRALENNIITRNTPFPVANYRIHSGGLSNSHLFGIENEERTKNHKRFRSMYKPYYNFDERYLVFFERELELVMDWHRPVVERWLLEYIKGLLDEGRLTDKRKAALLLKKCRYMDLTQILSDFNVCVN